VGCEDRTRAPTASIRGLHLRHKARREA